MQKRTLKTAVMVVHDLAATAAAVVLTFVFRFQDGALAERRMPAPWTAGPGALWPSLAAALASCDIQ